MPAEKIIEFILIGFFGSVLIWAVTGYVAIRTRKHKIKESDVTMGELMDHCKDTQAKCGVHLILANIQTRLKKGDETLEKHTETILKLNVSQLSEMITGSVEVNKRMIALFNSWDAEKNRLASRVEDLEEATAFLKSNRRTP